MREIVSVLLTLSLVCFAATVEARPNACTRQGLRGIPLMNCELLTYIHPPAGCVRATSYGNHDGHLGKPVSAGGVLDSHRATVAHKTKPLGSFVTLRRGN